MVTGGTCAFHLSPGSLLRESQVLDTNMGQLCVVLVVVLMVIPAALFGYRMPLEDKALRSEFGQEWDEWAKKVPYRLIPGVY